MVDLILKLGYFSEPIYFNQDLDVLLNSRFKETFSPTSPGTHLPYVLDLFVFNILPVALCLVSLRVIIFEPHILFVYRILCKNENSSNIWKYLYVQIVIPNLINKTKLHFGFEEFLQRICVFIVHVHQTPVPLALYWFSFTKDVDPITHQLLLVVNPSFYVYLTFGLDFKSTL